MAAAAAVLLESPQFNSTHAPLNSVKSPSGSYILSIASLPGYYATSASAPSNIINIFDKTTLQTVQSLPGHDLATTSLHAIDNISGTYGRTLMSSGQDGSVKIWDPRSNSHSIKMTNMGTPRSLLCCDVSLDGLTVAAGTDLQGEDASILYWDPRQPATPLRTHGSTHSDDITTVSFAPTNYNHSDGSAIPPSRANTLLSASSDGLVSLSNATEDDEDEAVLYVGNWGCSVSQAGWITSSHTGHPKIWTASDMETFSTWTHELDQCQSLDIRTPVLHGRRTWVTDYLITCINLPNMQSGLGIFVGSNEGDIALLSNTDLSVPNSPWHLHNTWSTGHVGVVRSLLWDQENDVLVTGGEDAIINIWPSLSPEDQHHSHMQMDETNNPRKRFIGGDEDEQLGKRTRQ